ncbi:MAG: tetratricopeptide repeat protein, partial [Saprospiraceae bacterium]|nr:tetratricopeptide repeat protein [Saprospiraceae bacterium]
TPSHLYYYASDLQRMGRYEEALPIVNKLLQAIPHHTNSYCLKGTILNRLGRYEEAIEHYQTVPVSADRTAVYYAGIGMVYAASGQLEKAASFLRKYQEDPQNLHLSSEENPEAIINIYLGNFDLAFEAIEKDIAAGKYYLNFYKEIPAFTLLQDDPRYSIFNSILPSAGHKLVEKSLDNSEAKKSLLDKKQIEHYSKLLLEHMAHSKPYLDTGLSLSLLAEQLEISPNQLSLVLNEGLGNNFNSFVNDYRVEEFMNIAKDPQRAHMTLVGLAYDAGFNSKTVFNTYFKQKTGLTPSQFLKN